MVKTKRFKPPRPGDLWRLTAGTRLMARRDPEKTTCPNYDMIVPNTIILIVQARSTRKNKYNKWVIKCLVEEQIYFYDFTGLDYWYSSFERVGNIETTKGKDGFA